MKRIAVKNNQSIPLSSVPEPEYTEFLEQNTALLADDNNHCVNHYAFPFRGKYKLMCCIANDKDGDIYISSSSVGEGAKLPSFAKQHPAFEKFEREIHENYGIEYTDHPWLKPVRFPTDRADTGKTIAGYPFFRSDSEELHEVGVGPIHAGVIEPGHFRFICNGEQILHLEIQLGYQHRGLENLMPGKKKLQQRITLAEGIAGDTVAGHATAFANLWESLCGEEATEDEHRERTLALELERLAVHTGDLSALCTDVAYQLGSAVFGRLRTPVINFFQLWCGNRLAKGLIRPWKSRFPFTQELGDALGGLCDTFEKDFRQICGKTFSLPTVLARFERTGVVTRRQASETGCVGMTARASGTMRDVRLTHPHGLYAELNHHPVIKSSGDVLARAEIRRDEILQSIGYIRKLLDRRPSGGASYSNSGAVVPSPASFAIALVEGWRGEICHCAVTDEEGSLMHYKIKDPSFHNWLALALAVRKNEISDFPVCNKSFNLSYCGHDL